MTGMAKAFIALVVVIIFPMRLQADTKQSGEAWNTNDELIDQCNARELAPKVLSRHAVLSCEFDIPFEDTINDD